MRKKIWPAYLSILFALFYIPSNYAMQRENEAYSRLGKDVWYRIIFFYAPEALKSIPLVGKYFMSIQNQFIETEHRRLMTTDSKINKLHVAASIGAYGWIQKWLCAHPEDSPCTDRTCCSSDSKPYDLLYALNSKNNTPLMEAIINIHKKSALLLFKTVTHNIGRQRPQFHVPLGCNDHKYLRGIVKHFASNKKITEDSTLNLIIWAAGKQYPKVVNYLINNYGHDHDSVSLLLRALKKENIAIMEIFDIAPLHIMTIISNICPQSVVQQFALYLRQQKMPKRSLGSLPHTAL